MSRHSFFGVGLILARLVARQVVLEINGPIREEVEVNLASRPLAVVADALMRIQVRAADCVVTVTPGLASYVEKRVPTSRCVVLPNGANPGHATRIPDQRDLSLIFVGALTPWYEMDVVLQALRELRDDGLALSLTVVGDGVRKAELVRQATALRVADLVTFAGWVESDHVQDAIERSQVGLLPLRPKHRDVAAVGSPLKLYEYLAAGLQVVGTDLDGIENAPAAEAVHTYTQGRSHSCAVAIRAALAAAGSPPLEAAVWSWDARATDLIAILME
jgi:glycosyltransferase involved in cell wall biosynthesis